MNANLESEILKLNPSQQEAVNAIEGPVLVVAGPGTGKTQVLSFRIANILSTTDAAANNILCLTFTESGVAAMRKRLLKLIGKEALYVRIHTFHSFCNEVILSHPENFSFAKELTQLDDLNRIKIIRLILDELSSEQELTIVPFYDKYTYQKNILDNIQALKREGVSAETLENICKETIADLEANPDINSRTGKPKKDYTDKLKLYKKNLELAMVYKKYSEVLLEKGFYDYEDMILFVIDKFKKDDELLAEYQEQFLYILVDEYQDTNGSQNELLKLFAFDKSPNIFAVGDDDQAIYRFQGANVENLLFFEKQFENVTTISLTTNYRSSQHILDLSSSLIDNNKA
ncbi:ATP-dependent helicase, partial [Candidatus Dojkabacteria bacterium]|nr:ATP-dependent helicase [Candidatus Dojkabacteria bacterium]